MKIHITVLVFLFLFFSVVTEVQAQQSNGHLPQCPETAPQVAIQVIAVAVPRQGINYRKMAIAGVAITLITGAIAIAVAGAGHGVEKAFINEDVEFPSWGAAAGAGATIAVSVLAAGTAVVCRCTR